LKFVVVASIVAKWFVAEAMSDQARLLLARRVQFFVPGLLLAEFANMIWKKARRGKLQIRSRILSTPIRWQGTEQISACQENS